MACAKLTGMQRQVQGVYTGKPQHWVGDGFHVTQMLPGGRELLKLADPFLLMDYHPVEEYAPTEIPRGVGPHPHRGFETVTLAFEGVVAHHDSTGAGGVIYPGDCQWMTAAGGILHKEYHEANWAKTGGLFHMMQLWVNLPGRHKMDPPGYQALASEMMGKVSLATGGEITLIAGELFGQKGPAKTFTPMMLWDIRLTPGEAVTLDVQDGYTTMLFPLEGGVSTQERELPNQQLTVFERDGDEIALRAGSDGVRAILLGGEPIGEPVRFYGPFAMNTQEELEQAIADFNDGKFGKLD